MRIGALAQQSGCTVEQIRFYEAEGLLPAPQRSDNGYRDYASDHVQRLLFIRRCRDLDMALKDIAVLLGFAQDLQDPQAQAHCDSTNAFIDHHRANIERRMRELQTLHQQLTTLRQRCNGETAACGILQALAE